MRKSQNGMIIRRIVFLVSDTLVEIAIESTFSLLLPVMYPLSLTALNRYLPKGSNTNVIFRSTTSPLLDFVTIH